ncbi:MAG: helix-turn-helix domain-containing protein [Symplocastrum torsivum CPER-KK1]|jgi:transcriptional regulator with XRE-family HTH domain|uniref:Helix-turn-helix domain-containing protein n=1 Tax=Symplocastrum torsivum CPER-KK1 TaxID=450513 RepID=A0A951PSP8_9CYAN|nr:helix-turn-helix domain-containing protein [Symplocastrum torsivum CPER-KK1]
MDSKTERLARIVAELRGSKSQRQFAKELGVSQSSVRFWESHLAWPETENLEKLAALRGWSLSDLQAYLVDGELPEEEPLEQVLRTVRSLPLEAVARVAAVAVETLAKKSLATQNSIKSMHKAVDHKAG